MITNRFCTLTSSLVNFTVLLVGLFLVMRQADAFRAKT